MSDPQTLTISYTITTEDIDEVKAMAQEQIKEFALSLAMKYDLTPADIWEFIPVKPDTSE